MTMNRRLAAMALVTMCIGAAGTGMTETAMSNGMHDRQDSHQRRRALPYRPAPYLYAPSADALMTADFVASRR
jgi:hypothetical protein